MRCVLPLAFLLLSSIVNAQDPPAPVQLARRAGFLSPDYYQQQMPLWSDYLADHLQDSHAWRSRYLSAEYSRSADAEQLDRILQEMSQAVPNCWQLPYLKARRVGLGHLERHLALLEEASRRCRQDCADIDESLGLIHELRSDTTAAAAAWKRFYASHTIATGLLDYNYNLLQTVEKDGVLITNGDNDTMPAWILQRVHGVRADVTIINLSVAHTQRPWLESQLSRLGMDVTVD
ncbi:MAG: hypothetical protein HOH74_05695, partial [Gemmatimonadetes bacterium]|nr:hypothetical protein [Gemmatimonadota bacterium]